MTDDKRWIEPQLSALLDGELRPDEERRVRAALDADPALAARLVELEEVDRALLALPASPVAGDAKARLRARIAAEQADASQPALRPAPGRGVPPRRWRATLRVASAAAMVLAAALLALLLLPPGPAEKVGPESTPIAERMPEDLPDLLAPEDPALDGDTLQLAGELPLSDLPLVEVLDWLEVLGELEVPERSG